MDQEPIEQFSSQAPKEQSYEERIAAYDSKHDIENFSIEDTLKRYYVRRTNGSVEQWLLVGKGPDVGKLENFDKDGKPIYKYLKTESLEANQKTLEMEFMINRAKTIVDLGSEANEAIPIVSPNDAMIREIPSFNSPQTAEAVSEGLAKPVESAEKVESSKYDYLRDFLPPTIRPEKPAPSANKSYDSFLNGGASDQPWGQQQARGFGHYEAETEDDKKRKYYDRFVTEENRQAGRETLMEAARATPEIREALNKHGLATGSLDAVDAIRENPEVRFEVAKVLAEKLDKLAESPYNDMGWRINDNSPNNLKSDAITGRKMLSRTYAVDMALKMIGGEFSTRIEGKDPIDRDKDGRVAIGQHRHAATTTLMSYERY